MKSQNVITIFLLILLFSISTEIKAQAPLNPTINNINWLSWEEGYKLSLTSNKTIMLHLFTDRCGWCIKMEKETYTNNEVVNLIKNNYIPIKLNPEKKGVYYTYKGQKLTATQLIAKLDENNEVHYPSILFVFPRDGMVILEEGYKNSSTFKQLLKSYIIETNNYGSN